MLRFPVNLSYLSSAWASLIVAYVSYCLFAIEHPECQACYYESVGFADRQQGK